MLRYTAFVLVFLQSTFIRESRTAETLFGFENPEENLISNWDLEEEINGIDIYLNRASGERVHDSNTGQYSYSVYNRKNIDGSLMFRVLSGNSDKQLKQNTNYYVSVYLKLANNPADQMYSNVYLMTMVKMADGTRKYSFTAKMLYQRYNDKWQQLGGDFKTPDSPFELVNFYLKIKPMDVNYYIDTLSVIELPDMSDNWKQVMTEQIDAVRKSDVTLNIDIGDEFIPGNTTIQIRQLTHDFKVGSALKAACFIGNETLFENYKNFALKYFTWAGFVNDFKWKMIEGSERGVFNFGPPDQALDILEANRIPVRAHAIFWDRMSNNPPWLNEYNGKALIDELNRRLDYVVERYKNRVIEWDVNNEYLHLHDYELRTGEYDLLCTMMKRAKNIDDKVKLCTNDYELVRNGKSTSAAVNLALDLQQRGCGIGCFGIQSHLKDYTLPIDTEVLKNRIHIACSAGLPVSITELSVHTTNVTLRADELEKAFYVYFSEECVHGILFWGFSDQDPLLFTKDSALTTGVDILPNEAGQRMIDLMTKVWNTTIDLTPSGAVFNHSFRAFHGSYSLTIRNGDNVLHTQMFRVKNGSTTALDITMANC